MNFTEVQQKQKKTALVGFCLVNFEIRSKKKPRKGKQDFLQIFATTNTKKGAKVMRFMITDIISLFCI